MTNTTPDRVGNGVRVGSRGRRPFVALSLMVALLGASMITSQPVDAQLNCGGRRPTIVGTDAPEVLRGTKGPDVIWGGGGNDRISARGGNDIVCGGPGRDRIKGGGGRDHLKGDDGDDLLLGGGGNDRIDGGRGDDQLAGGSGRDRLVGGGGFDECGPASIPGRTPGEVFGTARPARSCEVEGISLRSQSATFAGQMVTILGAVGSYESPFTFGRVDRDPSIGDQRYLYLELRVTNGLSETMRFDRDMLLLELPGQPTVSADSGSILVDAGSTAEEIIGFEVPRAARLSAATLVLGNSSVEQLRLPLTSAIPAERYPFPGVVDTTPRASTSTYISGDHVITQFLSAEWALELGDIGPRPDGRLYEEEYRAPDGYRFLVLQARFTEDGTDIYSENVLSDRIRVEIDGVPRSVWTRHNELLSPAEAFDDTVAFAIPADAQTVTVLVGRVGFTVAEFPVEVPDLSR